MQLQTTFASRELLADYIRAQFPAAAKRSPEISPIHGGRSVAEAVLQKVQPATYAATRNMLNGAVTRLSPYLKQGVVTLAEVRRSVRKRTPAQKAYKMLQELAWRDYYQRVYARIGEGVWHNIESYKTGVARYRENLPEDIEKGTTGAACIDAFAHDLKEVGYLHNHPRMWMAAYVVHHRRVRWQAGAYWFLQHLLDGDPASNNLSWQWVASTFAAKPYFFNRENLARYTENKYCSICPLAQEGCPFEGSYEDVSARIFPGDAANIGMTAPSQTELTRQLSSGRDEKLAYDEVSTTPAEKVLVWLNEESLNPHGPTLTAYPAATPVFVFDELAIEKAGWSIKRLAFIYECLLEIPNVQIYRGAPFALLTSLCQEKGYQEIVTTSVVDPRLQKNIETLDKTVRVRQYPVEEFAPIERVRDLRRFSRYWNDVEQVVVRD